MSAPDPITTGLVTAAALQVAKQGQDFIAAVCGHPGKTLATILGEWSKRRFDHMYAIGNAAHLTLLNLGVSARTDLPLKILAPLVEAASLEEEPELQLRWSNLLANAVDPRRPDSINAVFPYILRDFGAREVQFVDYLYEKSIERLDQESFWKSISRLSYSQFSLMELFSQLGFSSAAIHLFTPEAQQHPTFHKDKDAYFLMMDLIRRHDVIRETILPPDAVVVGHKPGERIHHFTELGTEFVKACRPPEK